MKSLFVTVILFILMLAGILAGSLLVHHTAEDCIARLDALPAPGSRECADAARAFYRFWKKSGKYLEFSVGFTAVDRVTEQATALAKCAEIGDIYGYHTALALLYDAVEDLRRTEALSFDTVF